MELPQDIKQTRRAQRTRTVRRAQPARRTRSRRERKKQETRQRLIECAWQLFQEQGYDDATVEDITEAADVAKGTFFNYFETKQAILDEIALWRIELLGSQALSAADVPESAIARIKLVLKAMADEFSPRDENASARDLTLHMFMARISAPIKHESAHRLGSLMHELVRQGQARHEIREDIDAGLVARLLMTCFFHTVARWHHPADDTSRPGDKDHPHVHRAHSGPRPYEARVDKPYRDRDDGDDLCEQDKPHSSGYGVSALMDSVDALMNGLGSVRGAASVRAHSSGPERRVR